MTDFFEDEEDFELITEPQEGDNPTEMSSARHLLTTMEALSDGSPLGDFTAVINLYESGDWNAFEAVIYNDMTDVFEEVYSNMVFVHSSPDEMKDALRRGLRYLSDALREM